MFYLRLVTSAGNSLQMIRSSSEIIVIEPAADPNKVGPGGWYRCDFCSCWGTCDFQELLDTCGRLKILGAGYRCVCALCKQHRLWVQCTWCGWWEEGDRGRVPFRCRWCKGFDEPPWWPNNRDRCHRSLQGLRLFPPQIPEHVLRVVACYIACNTA